MNNQYGYKLTRTDGKDICYDERKGIPIYGYSYIIYKWHVGTDEWFVFDYPDKEYSEPAYCAAADAKAFIDKQIKKDNNHIIPYP